MLTLRASQARGFAQFSWLHSQHNFSFGNYYDSEHIGFRSLRVINEDQIKFNWVRGLVATVTKIWKLLPMFYQDS